MYGMDRQVTYSDISQNGSADIAKIADYFQDCGSQHSDSVGGGAGVLTSRYGCVWLLNSWQIVVDRYPVYGEHIRVCTMPYGFDRVFAKRNFAVFDESGSAIVKADSNWFLYDIHTGLPLRMIPEVASAYAPPDQKLEMDYAPRKIRTSGREKEIGQTEVRKFEIDTNHHMNNAWYIRLAMQYLPDDFIVRQVRAEYRKAARLGETVRIFAEGTDDGQMIVMKDAGDDIYAVIKFSGESTAK